MTAETALDPSIAMSKLSVSETVGGMDSPPDGIRFVDYVDESQLDNVMSLVTRDLSEPYSIFTYRYFLYRFPDLCILAFTEESLERDGENAVPIGCVVAKIDMDTPQSPASSSSSSPTTPPPANMLDETAAGEKKTNTVPPSPSASAPTTTATSGSQAATKMKEDPSAGAGFVGTQNAATSGTNTELLENNEQLSPVIMTGYIGMLAISEKYRRRGIGKALVRRVISRMKEKGCTSITLETEVTNITAQRLYQDIFGFVREEFLERYYLNWNDAYRLRLWF